MSRLSRRRFITSTLAASTLSHLPLTPLVASDANDKAKAQATANVKVNVNVEAKANVKDVAWLDDIQRPPAKLPDDAPRLAPLLVDAAGRKITTLGGWKKRRDEIRRVWLEFLQPLKLDRPRPKLTVLHEDRPQGCIRQLVRYESEPGLAVEGYLLKPASRRTSRPGVVVMHSTVKHTIRQPSGVEGKPEKAFGLELARRGVVAFCPRCFLWQGEGGYLEQEPRHGQNAVGRRPRR